MIISDNLRKELHKVVEFIYDNEEAFILQFFNSIDIEGEIISVSFNEENIHFTLAMWNGSHVASSCKVDHFNDWIFRRDNV